MESTPDLSEIRDCHCLAARKRARAITRIYEAGLRPLGLRATQYSVLAVLELRGPTRIGEMSELLGLDRTSVTRTVSVMRRNDWVEDGDSGDARERLLMLTPSGKSKLVEAFPAWKTAQERVGREFGLDHAG